MLKIEEFKVNKSLAYLIQQVTKDSTQEILGYFYGISSFVIDDVYKKSKANYVNKDIVLFYKDTAISFRLRIYCGGIPAGASHERKRQTVAVSFPNSEENQNITDLMTKVVESGLGLIEEEEMPLFQKPELKTPACLRKIRIAQDEQRTKTNP